MFDVLTGYVSACEVLTGYVNAREVLTGYVNAREVLTAYKLCADDFIFLTQESLEAQLAAPGVGDVLDISFTSTTGEEVDLAKMKGKVVLVDFWATWCGPCIAEMPNVIAAYNKYHGKGFEIVGISLDQSKESLDAYVSENKMAWPQYFDGKGWQSDIAGKFGISSIPATFLVGKDGKVVASNLRGDQLEEKLDELLGAAE